jgi:hypothetical protein
MKAQDMESVARGDGEFSSLGVYAIRKVQNVVSKNQTMKVQEMEKGAWGDGEFSSVGVYVIRKAQKKLCHKIRL